MTAVPLEAGTDQKDALMVHSNITVRGRVQGVNFRAYTKDRAEHWGIRGYVRNQRDGTVFIEAEGQEDAMERFLADVRKGSPASEVLDVEVGDGEWKEFSSFAIES